MQQDLLKQRYSLKTSQRQRDKEIVLKNSNKSPMEKYETLLNCHFRLMISFFFSFYN